MVATLLCCRLFVRRSIVCCSATKIRSTHPLTDSPSSRGEPLSSHTEGMLHLQMGESLVFRHSLVRVRVALPARYALPLRVSFAHMHACRCTCRCMQMHADACRCMHPIARRKASMTHSVGASSSSLRLAARLLLLLPSFTPISCLRASPCTFRTRLGATVRDLLMPLLLCACTHARAHATCTTCTYHD